jgi:arylsulfatase A-like enzyme
MPNEPNILVVMCDQMRRQAMSCTGDPNVSTPALDGLAEDGVRFANANSTYPICVPARFSFVTGEHAHTRHAHHGWRMSPTERTFAHELSEAGYQTALIGKWHLADVESWRQIPEDLQGGFEYWRGFEVKNAPFDSVYFEDDDPDPKPIDDYQTDGLFDLAHEFLDDHEDDDRPFCLVLSVEPPHPPFIAPEEYLEEWTDRTLELHPNVPYGDSDAIPDSHSAWGDIDEASDELFEHARYHGETVLDEMRVYYAMIENLDDNVAELRAELDRRGLTDDTALVFISDHGEMMGSQGLMAKQHPYEESVGIPFIVSYPGGGIDDGRTVDAPTCTEDWYPTLLGLANLEAEDKLGTDLTPIMRGDRADLDREGVLLEFVREIRPSMPYHEETWRAFRTERYKYTVKGGHSEGGEPWQLFDLREDPYEQENLIDDPEYEDMARNLHGHLREELVRTDDDYALEAAFGHSALYPAPEESE